MNNKVISFPHLGDYSIPVSFIFSRLTNCIIKQAPPITKNTIELGSKYSPDFVCIPFKYNLGNFIESLEINKADILIQAGGGCRYGYYAEVQETILRDLGYDFKFYNITNTDHITIKYLYHIFREINNKLSYIKFFYYFIFTMLMIIFMDKLDSYIRENIGFEINTNSFINLKKEYLNNFRNSKNIFCLIKDYFKYKKKLKHIDINKKSNCIKVGVIGELYTSMEPFSNYYLEMELAKMNIQVKRFTNLTYLLFIKKFMKKKMLNEVEEYCIYSLGADGLDNVYRCKWLINNNYDGVIHIKPFGCTPEIGAIPIIQNVCNDYSIPIIFFSFDSQTSNDGIKTRLEAFYDMINFRRNK